MKYQIDYAGPNHDRPFVRRLSDGMRVTRVYLPRTKLELVEINGRIAVDVWKWNPHGYHQFFETRFLR